MAKRMAASVVKKRPFETSKDAVAAVKKQKLTTMEKSEEVLLEEVSPRVELDERTTQILEEELQAVMIKVWQSLPDSPPTPAERFVAERIRNEASDDIRNVLGLNVTKRLLNVYNPLILRIHFSRNPEEVHLQQFMKNYNIKEIKQNHLNRNQYIARVYDIADFDKICAAKNDRCGTSIVTMKPSYRFSLCPTKLNTVFIKKMKASPISKEKKNSVDVENVNEETANSETAQETVKSNNDQTAKSNVQKNLLNKNKATVQNETKANLVVKQESNPNKVENITKKVNVGTKNDITNNEVSVPKSNVVKNKNINTAAKPNVVTQATTVKKVNTPINNQKAVAKKDTVQKQVSTVQAKTSADIKPKPTQPNQENVATTKATELTPEVNEKPTAAVNTKPKPNQGSQKVVPTKNLEPIPKLSVKNEAKTNVTKPNLKQEVATKRVTEFNPKQNKFNSLNSEDFDDTDELNDEEILALISTGVIVDECSGSDEE